MALITPSEWTTIIPQTWGPSFDGPGFAIDELLANVGGLEYLSEGPFRFDDPLTPFTIVHRQTDWQTGQLQVVNGVLYYAIPERGFVLNSWVHPEQFALFRAGQTLIACVEDMPIVTGLSDNDCNDMVVAFQEIPSVPIVPATPQVPEPTLALLFGIGLFAFGCWMRRLGERRA